MVHALHHVPSGISKLKSLAQISPLLAAIIAPFSTLMDIPALTQQWYLQDGQVLPDFKASLILSALGLFFNVIANALLVFRFSASDKWWRLATHLSLLFWITKVIIAMVNLGVFGIASRNATGISYREGFWCAVASVIVSGGVTFLLAFHWLLEFHFGKGGSKLASAREIRVFGRHFMLQVTWFFSLIGLGALIFSRIEDWAYFDGIYFMVVTVLTVGFGDFEPTKTSSRIILFPFVVILIAQLANIIGMIITFFSDRTVAMEEEWQKKFEKRRHEERDKENPNPDLVEEIKFLEAVFRKFEMRHQIRDITISILIFFTFWFIGAVIFASIEGWPYGDALYFCYIFFLTIGYGDFSPETDGGKVFFVSYSLLAVPVMTSFAVQAVTSTLSYVSNQRLQTREKKRNLRNRLENGQTAGNDTTLISHAKLVEKAHTRLTRGMTADNKPISNSLDSMSEEEKVELDESDLTDHMLQLVTKLEGHSRRLLVGHLSASSDDSISIAATLLKADWNVQRRELLEILGDDLEAGIDLDGDGKGDFQPGAQSDLQNGVKNGEETMQEILRYRECFAEILAVGSRIKKLQGKHRLIFERRKIEQEMKEI